MDQEAPITPNRHVLHAEMVQILAEREEILRLARLILAEGDGTAEALGAELASAVLAYFGLPSRREEYQGRSHDRHV